MILADAISGHFGGHHYAAQAKSTGKRIPKRAPDLTTMRGSDRHHGRTTQRICTVPGCDSRADTYSETCIQHDGGIK